MIKRLLLSTLLVCSVFLATNIQAQHGTGSGTLVDPYIVSEFPYTFEDFNSGDGESAIGMQGGCHTLSCCSVKVFKVILPFDGSLRADMSFFTPLAGTMIAYYPNTETVTTFADLTYLSNLPGNFCGFRDTVELGYLYEWEDKDRNIEANYWRSASTVYDFESPNSQAHVPAGEYYILAFNENNQANLGINDQTDITFRFAAYCTNPVRYHVDPAASSGGDGLSWGNAFNTFEEALDSAESCDEIWLKKGTYNPTRELDKTTDSSRDFTFVIPNGVTVYGGFVGTELEATERVNFAGGEANETILSGDLNSDDMDAGSRIKNSWENTYKVVIDENEVSQESNSSLLDGVTVYGNNEKNRYFVDENASGINDGSTWTDAFNNLHMALENVASNDEVWLKKGTLTPIQEHDKSNNEPRKFTFSVPCDIMLYGGFEGTEDDIDNRSNGVTILNGDLSNNDAALGDTAFQQWDNTFHVASDQNGNEFCDSSILDGVMLKGSFQRNRIFVDSAALGDANGSSFVNGFTTLQEALDIAEYNDEIWVAKGTYYPTKEVDGTSDTQRKYAFKLIEGVAVYGGFSGTETDVQDRVDYSHGESNETILSGDFDNNDVITGTGATLAIANMSENAYHVIYNPEGHVVTSATLVDGFTITGGYASASSNPNNDGAGFYNADGQTPRLNQCYFYGNYAKDNAGALYFVQPNEIETLVTNCTFSLNRATDNGGAFGIFDGGTDTLSVVNSIFIGNRSGEIGGGAWVQDSRANFINCTVVDNRAGTSGGGLYNYTSKVNVVNSILWGNTCANVGPQMRNFSNGDSYYAYSLIQDGLDGITTKTSDGSTEVDEGNLISDDPMFVASGMHWYSLQSTSPAINVGDNTVNTALNDVRGYGFARTDNSTLDLGAYEYQSGNSSFDIQIIQGYDILSCSVEDAQYQWLDCTNNYAHISGATQKAYLFKVDGSYAVQVTKNGITDTSDCYHLIVTENTQIQKKANITVYPNPNNGQFTVELSDVDALSEIVIYNLQGRIVKRIQRVNNAKVDIDLVGSEGMFIVQVITENHKEVFKVQVR